MHTECLINLYKSILRPVIEYGCSVYTDASKTTLAKLDRTQHKILCKALGVIRLSRKANVNVESNTMPLGIRRLAYVLKFSQSNLDRPIPIYDRKRRNNLNKRRFKTLSSIGMSDLFNSTISNNDISKLCLHK